MAVPDTRQTTAVIVGGGQAGRVADGAVHVGDHAAGPADEVVVVVPDAGLVPCDRPGGLDAPDEAGTGQGAQHVVDRLVRHACEVLADELDDRLGVGVRLRVHRGQHREPGAGDPEVGSPQRVLEVFGL